MSRTVPALIVVTAVVVAVVASPLAVAAGIGDGFAQTTTPGAEDADAGAKLAGVVGSEGAEIEGDLQKRSFDAAIANASSETAKAAVVADAQGSMKDRLADLREQKAALKERYENGTISKGEYEARLARLGAQIRSLSSMANRTSDAARDLPAEALEAKGVNVTALDELRQNAANLSGPEVAAAARNLTRGGPPAGLGPDGERGEARGDGEGPGNAKPENVTTGQDPSEAAPANASDGANAGERRTGAAEKGTETSRSDAAVTENRSGATDRETRDTENSRRPTATQTSTTANATATQTSTTATQ